MGVGGSAVSSAVAQATGCSAERMRQLYVTTGYKHAPASKPEPSYRTCHVILRSKYGLNPAPASASAPGPSFANINIMSTLRSMS
jgi:hypothetical protein